MSFVFDHLEFLLQRHDCVVLPSLGAFMVRYRAAHFDPSDPCRLLPPSRELAFNGALTESDGMLESSVARKCGVSFEAARRMITEEISALAAQLYQFGELHLGRLGVLQTTDYGKLLFSPSASSNWDLRSYGLMPLELTSVDAPRILPAVSPYVPEYEEETVAPQRNKVVRGIIGIAASLAVLVTVALFLLYPIRLSEAPMEASLAPTAGIEQMIPAVRTSGNVTAQPSGTAVVENSGKETPDSAGAAVARNADVANPAVVKAADANSGAAKAAAANHAAAKTAEGKTANGLRFNPSDSFFLIVASFPNETEADRFLAENSSRRLGILHKDGRFRIYAATGTTYEQTDSQKDAVGFAESWVCRR